MKTLLEKLDRIAGQWINIVDNQLQEPTVRTLTGEVFTHDPSSVGYCTEEETSAQPVAHTPSSPAPARNPLPNTSSSQKTPVLQPARAAHKR